MLILYYVYFISANIKWFLRWFPLFLLLVIVVTIIASSMGIFESAVKQISHVDPLKHIFINLVAQANVAVEYLGIALLPLPSFLNVDHDVRWTDDFLNIQTLLSISIILLLIFLLFWLFNRNRLASFALLWMFLTHAPTSIMPRQEIMVEYRNYLPLFGFAIFVAIYLEMVFLKIKSNKVIPYAITLIMCVLFSIAVVERNKVWKDDETLWKDTVSKSPNKSRVHSGLAYHYYKTGRYDDAIVEAKKAIELDRSWLVPYVNLGLSYAHKKNSNGAIYWLSEVIKLYEDVNAFKKLLPPLYKELDLVPGLPSRIAVEAYNGIGTVYMDLGKYKEAEDNLKKAINILPTYGDAYLNLGVVYFRMNKIDEAMLYGKKALRYDPVSWEPHYFLSLMYLGKGDKVKAKEYFEAGRKFIRGTPKEKEQEIRLKKMLGK